MRRYKKLGGQDQNSEGCWIVRALEISLLSVCTMSKRGIILPRGSNGVWWEDDHSHGKDGKALAQTEGASPAPPGTGVPTMVLRDGLPWETTWCPFLSLVPSSSFQVRA